jgi:hypothetical protein
MSKRSRGHIDPRAGAAKRRWLWLALAALIIPAIGLSQTAPPPGDLLPEEQIVGPEEQYMQLMSGDPQLFQDKLGTADPVNHDGIIDEADFRYATNNWPLLPPDLSADEAFYSQAKTELATFIHDHRDSNYYPGYHPILAWDRDGNAANGIQSLLDNDFAAARAKLILPKKQLRVAETDFLTANAITEAKDSDGNWIYQFANTDPGSWYRFDNVKVTYYFQKKQSLVDTNVNNRYPDMEGTLITDQSVFESSGFTAKYLKVEAPINAGGSMKLTDPSQLSVKYTPAGDEAFDPGHTGLSKTDPKMVKQKMQTYVVVKATIMKGAGAGEGMAASSFASAGTLDKIGEQKIYVEDYWPPLPGSAAELAAAVVKSQALGNLPPSNADIDLPTLSNTDQGNATVAMRRGFPDPTKGESFLGSMNYQNDNPADTRVNSTLNFEIGRSIKHRFRYNAEGKRIGNGVTENDLDRLIIYTPAYEMTDASGAKVMVGPYVGMVWRQDDPYNTDEWKKHYTPIAFEGNLLQVVNHLYINSGPEQGAIQGEYGKTNTGNGALGYPYTAIVDYKFGAECVIGISADGLQPGGLPPGVIAVPAGFASYEGTVGNREYKASPGANLVNDNLAGKATSMNGKAMSGDQARDSFFKVNASDCCNNAKVILSGTFSTVDDVRPNLGVDLQEAQVSSGTKETMYVARLPNETSDGSNASAMAEYNLDSPNSRIDPTKATAERGYGDYANQAHTWDVDGTGLANPQDAQGRSFLDLTGGGQKPPVIQNHRMNMTICADDNVGEAMVAGKIVYPISHMSYKVIRPDGGEDGGRVLIDPANNNNALPEASCVTEPYIFRADGTYTLIVTARDLSGNERVMRTKIPVAKETPAFQQINTEQQRGNN